MSFGSVTDWMVVMIAQAGPTELFLPESAGVQDGGSYALLLWGVGVFVIVIATVWGRAMGQRRIDPRELAFRALSRKLKLSHKQVASLRAMSASSGLGSPVGLLLSPSAIRAIDESVGAV
ncbi:MAG: hypothetical protein JKY43_06730 [Phycisphaerales bacterium]|nr:hypothetical protein [Phycisphaerales bacterium]